MNDSAIIVNTTVEVIALAAAVGAVAGTLWMVPHNVADPARNLSLDLRRRLWKLLGLCLVPFTAASLLELLLRTASMSELPLAEAAGEIGTVLFKTHYGDLWLWRMGALAVLWIAWGMQRHRLDARAATYAAFAALTVIVFTFSAVGHAGDDGLLTLVNAANTLHILGAFLWAGGIIAMALIVLPVLLRSEQSYARELVASSSLRLSALAATALTLVLIPGLYHAWLQIGSLNGLIATTYGQVLLAKVSLVGVMMLLGALNRYRYVPALQEYAGRPLPKTLFPLPRFVRIAGDLTAVLHFLRSLRIEMTLALVVLTLAAALSQQTPAIHAEHEDMTEHQHHEDSPAE